jgi:hypothetical protein
MENKFLNFNQFNGKANTFFLKTGQLLFQPVSGQFAAGLF